MSSRRLFATLGLLGALALPTVPRAEGAGGDVGVRAAPEFPRADAAGWINSDPLTMRALRGQVVVLDIWTFG